MYSSENVKKFLADVASVMQEKMEELNALDAAMGDGDLGVSMRLGFEKASEAVQESGDAPGKLLVKAGKTIMEEAPSTLGTLFGLFIRSAGKKLGEKEEFDFADFVEMFEAGYAEMTKRGKAQPGEKTILDVFHPALLSLKESVSSGTQEAEALASMRSAAESGFEAAKGMKAVHGRPAYFGDRTIGMVDGGALAGVLFLSVL